MRLPLFHVDAFSNRPFSRDPAAVCLLQGCLDDAMLRKVATENNLSEVAFFLPVGVPYDLRGRRNRIVKLCRHATLVDPMLSFIFCNLRRQ